MSKDQSEAEKAAEEYANRVAWGDLGAKYQPSAPGNYFDERWCAYDAFLAGAAWAAPKWIKCSEEPPPDEEVLVVWSGTVCTGWYTPENGHLPACWDISGRNLPVDVTEVTRWMLKPAAPEVGK